MLQNLEHPHRLIGFINFLVPLSLRFIDNLSGLFKIFLGVISNFESMNSIVSQTYLVKGSKLHV